MDLLGFGTNASNVAATRPADTRVFGATDTYAKDCTTPTAGDGTSILAAWGVGLLQQLRNAIRGNGKTAAFVNVVTENNADDTMLLTAIQYLIQRGQTRFGIDTGAANALVVALSPALLEYKAGVSIKVLVAHDGDGSPANINFNGLGPRSILRKGAQPLQPKDLRAGSMITLDDDGVQFQLADHASFLSHGKVRLIKSGANLSLMPHDGNGIIVNDAMQALPPTGVALTPAGLAASTFYYIYLGAPGGVLTLTANVTGHVTNAANGIEIMNGDPTKTLVGAVRMNAGSAFQLDTNYLGIISYFSRQNKPISNGPSAGDVSTASNVLTPIGTFDSIFCSWGDDPPMISAVGQHTNNTANQTVNTALYVDAANDSAVSTWTPTVANQVTTFTCITGPLAIAEGGHIAQLYGSASANFAVWKNNAASLNVTVRG